ncbi:DUF2807 domain-containing protein [Massilia arenosa]|uniref:DUF2807 domain-containing protein n=1 Tax=Zemynaea arenosa TaxID=2561931 RepID=A0A4Y9SSJ8_9BURK|nr:head GIN domain-containing protein [Massilia arenosa]TFW28477.1 DUF2807 domain-containing protein [Massilia arenosa]
MRTLPLLTLAVAAALGGCVIIATPDTGEFSVNGFSSNAVKGNGTVTLERRQIAALPALDVSGPIAVEVRVGEQPSLEIEADSNLQSMIRTEANGDTLRIWQDGRVWGYSTMKVRYTVPRLDRVHSSGSGALTINGLNGGALALDSNGSGQKTVSGRVNSFRVEVNGSGSVHAEGLQTGEAVVRQTGSGRVALGQVQGERLSASLSGSGGLRASGSVQRLEVNTHGSGSADLSGLTAQAADLNSYGSGGIQVAVRENVVAQSNGSGHITVYGNPAQRMVSGKRVSVVN